MWYSGHDGTTGRILAAVQPPGGPWERLGVAIDAGFAGDSDEYGVESPCVVPTPGGYLMTYAGFDGEVTRLHMATSEEGRSWTAQGTIMQRGSDEALGASHPCLVNTEAGWWLFFCGYDGSHHSRRAAILAAVSPTGASWDRVGVVLEPLTGELAVSHPCVIEMARPSTCSTQATTAIRSASPWRPRPTVCHGTATEPCYRPPDTTRRKAACTAPVSSGSMMDRFECGTRRWPGVMPTSHTGSARRASRATGRSRPDLQSGPRPERRPLATRAHHWP